MTTLKSFILSLHPFENRKDFHRIAQTFLMNILK